MGKTVGTILEIGAIAALAYVTAGTAFALAGGASLGTSISVGVGLLAETTGLGVAAATSITLAGVGSLAGVLGPNLPKPSTSVSAVKTPIPERVAGYGRASMRRGWLA